MTNPKATRKFAPGETCISKSLHAEIKTHLAKGNILAARETYRNHLAKLLSMPELETIKDIGFPVIDVCGKLNVEIQKLLTSDGIDPTVINLITAAD